MVEALPWILVGLAGGIAVEWLRHRPILNALAQLPKEQANIDGQSREIERLKNQVADLQNQALAIPKLKAELAQLATKSTAPTTIAIPSEPAQTIDNPIISLSTPLEATPEDLSDLPGISPGHAKNLEHSLFNTFAKIATATPNQLVAAANAQPWDNLEPEAWIAFAKNPQKTSEAPQSSPSIAEPEHQHAEEPTKPDPIVTSPVTSPAQQTPTTTSPKQKMPWDPD
ncbi:hypothetical protein CCB80_02890 [Armatimonadetes bacterium Uphvl-Ar1]|nr:hypothetical protein CCB80_02890 [Armatimonadetes bacterium Uphvl-Ar1]